MRERRPRLRYQRYDWEHDAMDGWVAVAMPAIVIVEGVYTLRPQLRPLVDIAIVVETGEQTRLDRQVARGENSAAWIRRWAAAEHHYMRKHPPAPHADLVLLGE